MAQSIQCHTSSTSQFWGHMVHHFCSAGTSPGSQVHNNQPGRAGRTACHSSLIHSHHRCRQWRSRYGCLYRYRSWGQEAETVSRCTGASKQTGVSLSYTDLSLQPMPYFPASQSWLQNTPWYPAWHKHWPLAGSQLLCAKSQLHRRSQFGPHQPGLQSHTPLR